MPEKRKSCVKRWNPKSDTSGFNVLINKDFNILLNGSFIIVTHCSNRQAVLEKSSKFVCVHIDSTNFPNC